MAYNPTNLAPYRPLAPPNGCGGTDLIGSGEIQIANSQTRKRKGRQEKPLPPPGPLSDEEKESGGAPQYELEGVDWSKLTLPQPVRVKELGEIFGLTERHLRRLYNELGTIAAERSKGSNRISFSAEEIARLAASRFRKGRYYFNIAAAVRLGCSALLEEVHAAVVEKMRRTSPSHFENIRLELQFDLLVWGSESSVAKELGYTAAEIPGHQRAAIDTYRKVCALPGFRRSIAKLTQSALGALAVRNAAGGASAKVGSNPAEPGSSVTGAVPIVGAASASRSDEAVVAEIPNDKAISPGRRGELTKFGVTLEDAAAVYDEYLRLRESDRTASAGQPEDVP